MSNSVMSIGEEFLGDLVVNDVQPPDDDQRIRLIGTAEFLRMDCSPEWLIRNAMVADQPCIVGGPKKALKTSVLIDLAVSLASGQSFLGYFSVPRRRRVGLLSGESGVATLRETFRRIGTAKFVEAPENLSIHWAFRLPRLSYQKDLEELADEISDQRLEVVIIDPIYLALLAGGSQVQAHNLFEMGPLLASVTRTCLDAGATPIMAHHTPKRLPNPTAPLDLDDLAFAGFAEFARQWLLLSRRQAYEPGTGEHQLWLNVGASAGFSSCWAVDVREGIINDTFEGRMWDVIVRSRGDERQANAAQREQTRQEQEQQQQHADVAEIRRTLERFPDGETMSGLRDAVGIPRRRFERALAHMVSDGAVTQCQVLKGAGRSQRPYEGYRLVYPPCPRIGASAAAGDPPQDDNPLEG